MARSEIKAPFFVATENQFLKMRYVKNIRFADIPSGATDYEMSNITGLTDIANKIIYLAPSVSAAATSLQGLNVAWNTYNNQNRLIIVNPTVQDVYVNILVFYTD